jgi:hypothetical protein
VKLAMTLLVRDEADIIAANLDYHFAQGVDFAVVTDNRSKDDTRRILRGYQKQGRIRLLRERAKDFKAQRWRTRMSRVAAEEGADWVITNDADEFWWPREGDLRASLERFPDEVGVVLAPRSNFVPAPEDGRPFLERMILREVESRNPFGKPLQPKVAHRASAKVKIAQGNHKARGVPGKTVETDAFEVLHFPWRSYEQFEAKVVAMGRAYERNKEVGPGTGRVRRWLFEVWQQGGLPDYYAQQLAADGPREGLVEDVRLRDFMRAVPAERTLVHR